MCHRMRAVFPRFSQRRILVFGRAAILGSAAPAPSITTRKRDGSMRATTSFTVKFWALVLLSSAKEGVKTVIILSYRIMEVLNH